MLAGFLYLSCGADMFVVYGLVLIRLIVGVFTFYLGCCLCWCVWVLRWVGCLGCLFDWFDCLLLLLMVLVGVYDCVVGGFTGFVVCCCLWVVCWLVVRWFNSVELFVFVLYTFDHFNLFWWLRLVLFIVWLRMFGCCCLPDVSVCVWLLDLGVVLNGWLVYCLINDEWTDIVVLVGSLTAWFDLFMV